MDSNLTQSALLTTSAKTDVQRSGGKVTITGLLPFDLDKMLAASYKIHRAEVQQVVTVDLTSVTMALNTRFSIKVGNVLNEYEAGQEALKNYAFTSGGTAPTAVTIADGIVAAINNTSISNYVSAVRAANTVVITDDAGYYPIRPAGRAGPSTVTLGDGVSGATITETTAGVIAYGDGTYIASNVPVKDPMSGNLISGELDTPTGAVAGQFYSGFYVTYAKEVNHQAVSGLRAEKVLRQLIYVDNGLGTATANVAGYAAFLKEFEKVQFSKYASDPNSLCTWFDSGPTLFDQDGVGVPSNGDEDENLCDTDAGQLRYFCIGATATDPTGFSNTTGFDITRGSETNAEGIELSAEVGSIGPLEYTVGTDACSFSVRATIADVTGLGEFAVGFRLKEAYQDGIDDYNDMACLNVQSGNIMIETIDDGGATTSTDTTQNWADTETHTLEVSIDATGVVTYRIDDGDPTVTAAFTWDDGDTIIPFIHKLSTADLGGAVPLSKWLCVADTFVK